MSCYEKTKEKLIKNKDLLIKMSDILMKKETLNGEEVDRIMKGENILEKTNEN
jgi:ATP-dependent Zn protease